MRVTGERRSTGEKVAVKVISLFLDKCPAQFMVRAPCFDFVLLFLLKKTEIDLSE
jgi:hypothetical protein